MAKITEQEKRDKLEKLKKIMDTDEFVVIAYSSDQTLETHDLVFGQGLNNKKIMDVLLATALVIVEKKPKELTFHVLLDLVAKFMLRIALPFAVGVFITKMIINSYL